MNKPAICIVSPALAAANNGNWQTASRWASFLASRYHVAIAPTWPAPAAAAPVAAPPAAASPGPDARGASVLSAPDLLIALHARRSAPAMAAFRAAHPGRPILLILTGTDLYRDIRTDATAQASLDAADALVVLQPAGLDELPAAARAKAHVIFQSAPPLPHAAATGTPPTAAAPPVSAPEPALAPPAAGDDARTGDAQRRDILMIGHLRDEKDPLTFMRAASLVQATSARLVHIGGALDAGLAEAAGQAQRATARYAWLGALPHEETRERLRQAHAMAICSRMEGGANVIIEAVTSGVPVLASDISGNKGMLGNDYEGYFPLGDAGALAALIDRCVAEDAFAARLRTQCAARAHLFAPAAEQATLLALVDNLLNQKTKDHRT